MTSRRSKFLAGLKQAVKTAKNGSTSEAAAVAVSPCQTIGEDDFHNFLDFFDDEEGNAVPETIHNDLEDVNILQGVLQHTSGSGASSIDDSLEVLEPALNRSAENSKTRNEGARRNLFPHNKDVALTSGGDFISGLQPLAQEDFDLGTNPFDAVFNALPFGTTNMIVLPGTSEVVPEAAVVVPEAAVVVPEEAVVVPEAAQVVPETARVIPDSLEVVINDDDGNLSRSPQSLDSSSCKPKTRKRLAYPQFWKRNANKLKRNKGEAYTNSKGVLVPAKTIGPACEVEYCRSKCAEKIKSDDRNFIFKEFWNIEDPSKKWYFVSSLVHQTPKKSNKDGESRRKNTRIYHLRVKGELIRVCKTMFIGTLGIGEGLVDTAMAKLTKNMGGAISPDKRGKKSSQRPRTIQESVKESVRNHINSIPRMARHYTRATSSREFLIEDIQTITDMHSLYVEWVAENDPSVTQAASYRQYADIFNTEFNISFFISKKDQCDECTTYQNSSEEEKKALEKSYSEHTKNKDLAIGLQRADVLVSRLKESKALCVASFDYQKTLNCPKAKASVFYYRRKLGVYNFSIADAGQYESFCYVYTETVAGKGANEVSSFLYHFILSRAAAGVKEFRLYSDNCPAQNKNRAIAAVYLHLSAKLNVKITHRFLEKGHTYLGADKIHSTIEKRTKPHDIYSPDEWYEHILKSKKPGKKPMNIIKVDGTIIFDWMKDLVPKLQLKKNTQGRDLAWLKIREMSTDGNLPYQMKYKEDYNGPTLEVSSKNVGRPVNLEAYSPTHNVRNEPRPLSKAKHGDLMYYCDHNFIPPQYHEFYRALPVEGDNAAAQGEEQEEEQEVEVQRVGRARKRRTAGKKGPRSKRSKNTGQGNDEEESDS